MTDSFSLQRHRVAAVLLCAAVAPLGVQAQTPSSPPTL